MILLALLFCILPFDTAARERVDQIEVQFTFSWSACEAENGDVDYHLKPVFVQLLFRRWNGEAHVIEAWRMAKPTMVYQFVHSRGVHEIRWFDGDVERVVETKSMVYSSSDFDSEVQERSQWPREHRRDLLRRTKGRE